MKKLFWTFVALSGALVSLLPGVSQAGQDLNHNQTRLGVGRKVSAVALAVAAALMSMIPTLSEAGHNLYHSQTTLRG